jgi:thiaminase
MVEARELIEEIRHDLEDVDREIREHSYPAYFEEQHASEEDLVPFVASEWYIAQSDLRSFAKMTQRFGEDPTRRDFFHDIYQGEDIAVNGLFHLAEELGLSDDDLRTYDISPRAFGYAAFVAWSAQYASAGEVATAILVNFDAWGHNCGRLRDALEVHYGYTEEDTVYLATFADLEPFEEQTIEILQTDLDHGLDPQKVRRAARLYQGYEKMFWDEMEQLAGL